MKTIRVASPPLYLWFSLLFFAFFNSPYLFAQEETVQVTVLNGDQIRCSDENFVEIEITPNPSLDDTQIQVFWGDNPNPIVLTPGPGDESFILSNTYDLSLFEDDCTYGEGCGPGFFGFCFSLTVLVDYSDGDQENTTNVLSFRVPPRPALAPNDGYICAGETVTLANNTCPENDPSMRYYWILPDGTTSTEFEPEYIFDTPGIYPVTLSAANTCDSVTITRNIVVNDLAMAALTLDSGAVSMQVDTFTICLTEGGFVRLNADGSTFATSFDWDISPAGFTPFGPINQDTLRGQFTQAGFYTATVTVDNDCEAPDEATIFIEVIDGIDFTLVPQPDICEAFDYSPDPLEDGIAYILNGISYTINDFPLTLDPSPVPYTLSIPLGNICESDNLVDTFFVFAPVDPTITNPANDLTICRDTVRILLEAEPTGGDWSVDTGADLIVENGNYFFLTDQENGSYTITYTVGTGNCERSTMTTITIESPEVEITGPFEFCADGSPANLMANPPGGTWSGDGITDANAGIFDPTTVAPGVQTVFYTFNDAAGTGCIVTVSAQLQVIALPMAMNVPDTFSVCAVDDEFLLESLIDISFDPNTGTVNWVGNGITNPATGSYNPAQAGGMQDVVSFTYSIPPGCAITDTIVLTIDDITAVNAGPDLTICDNEDNPVLSATPGGGRWDGEGIDEDTGEIDLSQLSSGQTYEYIYFINENFAPCINSDTVLVTIAAGGGVSVNPGQVYLCDTASMLTLPTPSNNNGSWEGSPGINGNMLDLTGIVPDTFSLFYVVPSLPAACNSAELTIYYAAQPTVTIIGDDLACEDVDCVEFLAQTGGAQTFAWDFGDGASSADQQTCHIYTDTGLYPASLVGYLVHPVTNENYCASAPANTEIEILGALEEMSILADMPNACPDFLANLAPSIVDPRNSYSWSVVNIIDSIAIALNNVLLPATTEDTSYLVFMVTTNGCDSQVDSLELIANAPLVANIGTDFDLPCSGEMVALYNRSTGTSGNTPHWIISNGIEYFGFEPPPFQVFTDSLPSLLEIMLIDSNACNIDTVFYTIEIQPTDVRARMNFSSPTVCVGEPLLLINASTPNAQVSWETSDGNTYLGDTVTHTFLVPGPVSVTIFATGCGYDSLIYNFEVLPAPELDLVYDNFACAEAEATFSVSGNTVGHVLYYGTGDSTSLTNSSYHYPTAGTYELQLVGRSQAGCMSTITRSITIGALPIPLVAPTDSVCANTLLNLNSLSSGAESCIWLLADGTSLDQCNTSYAFQTSGTQTHQLIAISPEGCPDTAEFVVYVRPTPEADFSFERDDNCSPVNTQFSFTQTEPLPSSWQWQFGDGGSAITENPFYTYAFGGTYEVELIVGVEGICFDTLRESIVVRGTPLFDTLVTDTRCLPEDAFIIEVATDESNEITVAGDNYLQAGINRFEIVPPGDYTLEVLSADGCDTMINFVVPEVFPLELELMPDTTLFLGESVQITNTVNESNLAINWSPIRFLSDTSLLEPIATPLRTTLYVLTVSSENCSTMDTVIIKVDTDVQVYFPNAFSPNDDGKDDIYTFYPQIGVEAVEEFMIFDRWGNQVYLLEEERREPFPNGIETWNGQCEPNPNSNAYVYYAVLRYKNEEQSSEIHTGWIYLLK